MNFLAPMAFTFAATIPVVVLFYLLKRKRVVKLVSSTLLWQKFLAESQASSPFQKLRHNWLLVLQILMLLLAILALARPYFAAPSRQQRLLVFILDASASMQSVDASPSRFEAAREQALSWLDSLRSGDQVVVLEAGPTTRVKQSPTSSLTELRRALKDCRVTDGPTRLTDALKLAETLTRDLAKSEIHLFSDGIATGLNEFETKGLPLFFHKIGKRGANAGIVSLDVKAHPEDPARRALYASVANYATNALETELELKFNDQVLEVRPLAAKPRETVSVVFSAQQAQDGVFSLRLAAKDDLAADNQAFVMSLLPRPVKVLLVSKGNRFLEKALRGAAHVELATANALLSPAREYDLVVLDDVFPAVWPTGNLLAIHTYNTNWFTGGGPVGNPAIVAWKSTHPLLRWVNFDNVAISEAMGIQSNLWATPILEATQTPLILAGDYNRQRIVWIGFDVLQSTWPYRVSFPIFMANAVEWLNPAAAYASQLQVKAGLPFRLTLTQPADNTPASVKPPDGPAQKLALENGATEVVIGDTSRQGIYHLKVGTNELAYCVNLLDAAESDNAPRAELTLGGRGKVAATTLRRVNMEWWRWLAAAGLAVLLYEWWYYHRRTA